MKIYTLYNLLIHSNSLFQSIGEENEKKKGTIKRRIEKM